MSSHENAASEQRTLDQLLKVAERSEARLQALERRRHWQPLLLASMLLGGYLMGTLSAGSNMAVAEPSANASLAAPAVSARTTDANHADAGPTGIVRAASSDFHRVMSGVRQEVSALESGEFDSGKAIAVILHDMRELLEAMPEMASDMRAMTGDMHKMSADIGAVPGMARDLNVMTHRVSEMSYGVNSTLGRMGGMMPW